MKIATARCKILQPQLVYKAWPELREPQRYLPAIRRDGHPSHLLRSALQVGAAISWSRFSAVRLNRVTFRPTSQLLVDGPEKVNEEAVMRCPHLGNAARQLVGINP